MPFVVISDVHANLEALKAVLGHVESIPNVEAVYFIGDAVGYGPDPNECTEDLSKSCRLMLAGNHDWAALGLIDPEWFNPVAKKAINWTASVLKPEVAKILKDLPLREVAWEIDMLLVHSSPKEPEAWHYLMDSFGVQDAFDFFDERICIVGHSHMPFIAELLPDGELRWHDRSVEFREGARYLINAGSVGQPRDGDPRACLLLIDSSKAELKKVEYPVEITQAKMKDAGLPKRLIERLSSGV